MCHTLLHEKRPKASMSAVFSGVNVRAMARTLDTWVLNSFVFINLQIYSAPVGAC